MEELATLQRRQELGMLGLTDAERAQLEAELIDPMRTTRREQQLQFQQSLQGADVGAGSFYKMGIGEENRVAAQEQEVRNKIEASNMAVAAQEQARIYELIGEEQKRADAARGANIQSLQAMGGVAAQVQEGYGQKGSTDAFTEMENALLNSSTTSEQKDATQQDFNFLRYQRTGSY
tara:strand:- start:237 stop:767 length:531 start_codon:yes stop_codon:yes gene_type:complete